MTKFSKGVERLLKIFWGVKKFYIFLRGGCLHKTSSTGVSKGVEKYWNFLRRFLKNSDFLRGFLKKKFLRGSKIRNLVNGGVWILNGMAQRG